MSTEHPLETSPLSDPRKEELFPTIKLHCDENDFVVGATYEDEGEDIQLFPIEIGEDPKEEYIPDLSRVSIIRADVDEGRNNFHLLDFTSLNSKLKKSLEKNHTDFDLNFINFAEKNLPPREYMQFVIEQEAINGFFECTSIGVYRGTSDQYSLLFEWPHLYYPHQSEMVPVLVK